MSTHRYINDEVIHVIEMKRRQYLTMSALAATGLSGCTSSFNDGPQYDEDSKDEMLLSVEAFPDGWHRDDDINDNFDAVFANEDDSIVVMLSIQLSEDIETAKENFESSKSSYRDPQEIDIGDEAFWDTRNEEMASTIFRHSNALGQTVAARQSGMEINPDQQRSQNYAGEMYDHWQDL